MPNGLPVFLEDVPDYSVRDGRMCIAMGTFKILMPLHVFLDGCELGKAAIVDWQRQQCGIDRKVVPFRG
jgi:hypothetical protein